MLVRASRYGRVLGIDPGSRFVGFGVVERLGARFTHVSSGVVKAAPRGSLSTRLRDIYAGLSEVVARFQPQALAVEGVFTHKNARSALILGHARGVVLLLAAQSDLSVHEYAPARVKRSVGAGGNDGKAAVARMVSFQLGLKCPTARFDASDALAVAICHLASPATAPHGSAAAFAGRLKASYRAPGPLPVGGLQFSAGR